MEHKSYEAWVEHIKVAKDKDYYDNIIKYSKDIANDIHNYKHFAMARRLNVNVTVLSNMKPLILALAGRDI